MIERIYKNKISLVNYFLQEKGSEKEVEIKEEEWEQIGKLKQILEPFNEITNHLCSTSRFTSSLIFPIVQNILDNLLKGLNTDNIFQKEIKEKIKQEFTKRIGNYNDLPEFIMLATFLDPRFKNSLFTKEIAQKLEVSLYQLAQKYFEKFKKELEENKKNKKSPPSKQSPSVETRFDLIFGQTLSFQESKPDDMQMEIKCYLEEEKISIAACPIE